MRAPSSSSLNRGPEPPAEIPPLSHGTRALLRFLLALLAPLAPLVMGAFFIVGFGSEVAGGGEESPSTGARKHEAPLVISATVQRRSMVRYLETTTKIESEREITIHPETSGLVMSVLAEEGDEV